MIRRRGAPIREHAGIAVLRGNSAPSGAVIKPAAASPELLRHRGRAVVFDSIEDMNARIDLLDLDVDHVMQADTGADLDFLFGSSGDRVARESH